MRARHRLTLQARPLRAISDQKQLDGSLQLTHSGEQVVQALARNQAARVSNGEGSGRAWWKVRPGRNCVWGKLHIPLRAPRPGEPRGALRASGHERGVT